MELRLAALLVVACAIVGFVNAGPRRHTTHLNSNVDEQLVNLLTDICSQVTDEVRGHVPAKFAELAHSLKSLPRESIARIDQQVHDSGFCASTKVIDIWNDALIMDASEGSLKLIADQIIRKQVSPVRANYLFTMMAFSRKPSSGAVRAVLPILQEKDVPRQALLGISALVRSSAAGQQTAETREAVRAIAKYLERNIRQQDRVVVALKALQNIAAIDEVVDKVISLATDASQKSGVRVAAIDALVAQAEKEQVRSKCIEIFQNTKESSEIRIAAYKILIQSRDRQIVQRVLQTIRREENKQVGAFVTTHLKNLQESSSPRHEAVRQILQDEKIPIERFPQDLRKYSRNFELSQYIERLGLGGVFDADLIYDKSFTPRSLKMNLTVPLSETEVNVFEFGFRQVGLEDEIRKLVGPHLRGRNAPEIMTEVIAEMVDLFDQESASNEVPNARFARNVQKRQSFFQKLNSKDDVEAAIYLNVDGKTIAYFDIADMRRPENDMSQALRSVIQEIRQSDKVDRAYSFMFMKKEFEVPSKDGPTPVAVNGTIIFGLKGDKNTFVPSVAIEMSTRTSEKRYQQRVSSSADLRFDVEYKNNRPVKVALRLPKESQKLFHVQSAVFDVDTRGVETASSASYKKMSKCTTSLTRPFGIEFCGKIATPDEMLSNGIPPFNGLWEVEFEVMKTDRHMNGWELTLEVPESDAEEWTYRVAFDTPSSRVQRRAALLVRSYDRSQGLQLKLESPAAAWDASAVYVMKANEWSAKSELTIGSSDKYSFEAGVRKEAKNKKQEWIPVFRVSAPRMQPIALTGALSVTQGRKSQLSFELRSEISEKQFLKGSFIQEGAIALQQDFRLSSDVQADFGPVNFRVFSSAELQANSFSTDLKIDYQTPNSRKHTIKVVGKLHNLSTPSYTKVNSFVEAQTSQYPEKNFHVSWNVLHRPQQHLENELTIMWDGQMRDQNKKIHILQISKATGLIEGRVVTADNIVSVEIAPIDFKYEFKASGNMDRTQTQKFKVQLEMNNKNQKNDDVQMSFEVQHVSEKPFKMTIDAALISAARELRYSDKVEEVSPKVYKGRTQVQWQKDKKTTIGYTLRDKSDRSKTDLEVDAEIKTPLMRHGLRHQGFLRIARQSLDLQSKVSYEKTAVWEASVSLRPQAKSTMRVNMKGFEGKAEADVSSSSKSLIIDLKGNDFTHNSNLLIARDAATLTSKTTSDQKPVLAINVRQNAKYATRVNIECTMFDARAEVSGLDARIATAVFDLRGKTNDKLALKTKATFSVSEGLELTGESKSESYAPHSASLKIKRSSQGLSATVHSEHNNKEWIVGKALLEQLSTGVRANAQLSKWGNQVGRFQSQLHRQVITGPHDLEINFKPESSAELKTLKIHHEIADGEAKCLFTYLVDGQQKGSLENFARIKLYRSEFEIAAGFALKCETGYAALKNVQLSFQHRHKNERRNFQSESRVTAHLSEEQKYELAITSARSADSDERKANIKLSLKTPTEYNSDVQASFDVQYTTKQKFAMTIDAAVTTAARTLRYSDKVEEISPRVFKGKSQIQWEEDKKTTVEYTVTVEADRSQTKVEVDADIKTPLMRHGLRHQGLIRIARESVDVKSKVVYENANVWDIDAKLRQNGKSVMRITMEGFEGKAEADVSSSPKKVLIDVKGEEFTHVSNLMMSGESVNLRSKTMSGQKPKFVIDANMDENQATRVKIQSDFFDSRFEMNSQDESAATAAFEFEGKTGDKWTMNSKASYTASQGLEVSGECKSESFDPCSARMTIKRTARGYSADIHSEQNNKEWISGKASLDEVSSGFQANAQLSKKGKEIGRIQSQLHRQVISGPHDFEFNFRSESSAKMQTLKLHHEIGNGQAKCLFTYLVDGQQKGQLENFARFKSSRSELDVAAGFTLQCDIRQLENVHLSFQHHHKNERKNFQSESRAKAQLSEQQKYELSLTSSMTGDHIREPLKLTIDAAAITPEREIRYSDNVVEFTKNSFKGKAQIQWEQDKKTTIDYTVKYQNDRREFGLEVDSLLKSPSMRHGIRHVGRVQLARGSVDVQSKVDYERSNMWDIETKLRMQEKSTIRITVKGFEGKAEADLSSTAKSAMIDLKSDDFTHVSNLLVAKDTVTFESKTTNDKKSVLVIRVRQNEKQGLTGNLECTKFESRLEVSGQDASPAFVTLSYKEKTGNKLSLKSKGTFSWADGLELTGECKSNSIPAHSVDLKIKRKSQGISAAIHSERNGKEWISGKALLEEAQQGLRVNAQLSKFGAQIGQIQSKLHRRVISGPHDVEINFKPDASAQQQTLKIHHEIGNGEAKCLFTYLVDGQQKGQLENFARFKSSRSEFEIAAGTILKSEIKYQGLDGVHLSFQHRHKNERRNFESDTRVKAQLSEEQKYELSLTSGRSGDRNEGKANIKLNLQTPLYDFKQQSSQWTAEWTKERISVDHKTTAKDVSILFECSISQSDMVRGPHMLNLKYTIPRYAPWSLQARHEIVNGNLKSHAEYQVDGVLPKTSILLKARTSDSTYMMEYQVKRSGKDFCAGQLVVTPRGHGLNAVVKMTQQGKEWVRLNAQVDENWMSGPHDIEVVLPKTIRSQSGWYKLHHEIVNGKVNSSVVRMLNGKEQPIGEMSGRGLLDTMAGIYMKA